MFCWTVNISWGICLVTVVTAYVSKRGSPKGVFQAFWSLCLTSQSKSPTEAHSLPPQASASRTRAPTSPEADARISFKVFGILTLGLGIPTATPWVWNLERPLQNCLGWGPTTGSASVKFCRTPKPSPVLQKEQPMEAAAETPPTPPQGYPGLLLPSLLVSLAQT